MRAPALRTARLLLVASCAAALAACDVTSGPDEPDRADLIVYTATPDGVAADEAREVFVVRPDGSERTQLTEGAFAFAPAWSPDGRRIAFTSLAEDDPNVFVMDADGGNIRRVTSDDAAKFHVTWIPGGERLAYVRAGVMEELYAVPVEGGEPERLRECPDNCQWPRWSPDGSQIAFEGRAGSSPRILLVAGDASGESIPLGTGAGYESQPSWSPDGSLLAFISDLEPNGAITLVAPDGSDPSPLTADLVERSSPGFSPDGSRIVFYQRDPTAPGAPDAGGINTMTAEGDDIRRVVAFPVHSFTFVTPRWRPS